MKKVKFLRDFYRNGSKHLKGDIAEFTSIQADELLKRGVATDDLKSVVKKTKETKEK